MMRSLLLPSCTILSVTVAAGQRLNQRGLAIVDMAERAEDRVFNGLVPIGLKKSM